MYKAFALIELTFLKRKTHNKQFCKKDNVMILKVTSVGMEDCFKVDAEWYLTSEQKDKKEPALERSKEREFQAKGMVFSKSNLAIAWFIGFLSPKANWSKVENT